MINDHHDIKKYFHEYNIEGTFLEIFMRYELLDLSTGYYYRSDIQDQILNCLDGMIQEHCKVFTIRLDIRFPEGYSSDDKNKEISKLMSRLNDYSSYHKIDMRYIWAREKNNSPNHHYHAALILDGSKTQNGWGMRNTAERIWSNVLGTDATGCIGNPPGK
jgi:hypothetical protein